MKTHFENIINIISNFTGHYYYEQSFMNVYFNLNNLTDRNVISKHNYKLGEKENELYEGKLIHFYGEASYAFQKKVRMNIYFEKYINTRV